MQGGIKNSDFRPIARFILEIIQDKAIDMEGEQENRAQAFEWYQFQRP